MTKNDKDKWLDDLIDADLANEGIIPEVKTESFFETPVKASEEVEEIPAPILKLTVIPTIKKYRNITLPSISDTPVVDSFFIPKTGMIFDYDAEIVIENRISNIPSILNLDVSGNDPDVNYTAIRSLKQYRQYAEKSIREGKDFELFSDFVEQINRN